MAIGVSFRLGPSPLKAGTVAVGFLFLFTLGCQGTVPTVDNPARQADAFGTISGTIRVPQGTSPVAGRVVEVINTETGERQRLTTSNVGGFTFKVRPGKHRVEVELREGESIVKQPGIMNVNRTGIDNHADFIIGTVPAARPPSATKQGDPGLGPPIA